MRSSQAQHTDGEEPRDTCLAEEGADIIAVDLCAQIDTIPYPMSTPDDLALTVKEVEALGRQIVAAQADVRDRKGLQEAFDDGVAQLGRIDIVVANAGIMPIIAGDDEDERTFDDVVGVNLKGVWNTIEVARPALLAQDQGGSIILTSSTAGVKGSPRDVPCPGYTAAKHGVIGLMHNYANTLAEHSIRVNVVAPTGVNTPMAVNEPLSVVLEFAADGRQSDQRHAREDGRAFRRQRGGRLVGGRHRPLRDGHRPARRRRLSRQVTPAPGAGREGET